MLPFLMENKHEQIHTYRDNGMGTKAVIIWIGVKIPYPNP